MKLIETSIQIALRAYAGKTDKAGREHDVIEDSDITAEDLLAEGIPAEVVEAVKFLTKREGEDYMEFVARAKKNKLAAKVKIADIEDNIDVSRLTSLDEHDPARIKKYHFAWRFLKDEG